MHNLTFDGATVPRILNDNVKEVEHIKKDCTYLTSEHITYHFIKIPIDKDLGHRLSARVYGLFR